MADIKKTVYLNDLMELFFQQGSVGLSFALMDKPVDWRGAADKDKALDTIFYNERVVRANDLYLKMFNIDTIEELLNRTPSDFFMDDKQGKALWRELLDSGYQKFNAIEMSPGVWVEGINQCLYDEKGYFIGHVATVWDVSDKKNELNLANQDRLMKKICDFLFKIDKDGNPSFPFVSSEFFDIFGIEPEDIREDAKPLNDITYFADKERVIESLENSGKYMSHLEMEFRIDHPSKGLRWIKSISRPERPADGGIVWQGYFSDITEDKKSEEWILFLNSALENISDSVIITGSFGGIIYANSAATKLHGYTKEELYGRDPDIFLIEPVPEEEQTRMFKKVAEGGTFISEAPSRRKDGSIFDCEYSMTAIFDEDGVIKAYIGVQRDITERNKMLEALKKSNQRFEQLTKQSRAIAWEIDKNGLITYMSNAVSDVLGYSPREVVGKKYLRDLLDPCERDKIINKIKNNDRFTAIVCPVYTKTGDVIHMAVSGMPVKSENDSDAEGYHGLSIDITEKVDMELIINNEKERYRTTLLSVGDGVISTDGNGNITVMNPVAEKLTGWSQKEAKGQPLDDVFKIIDEVTGRLLKNPAKGVLSPKGKSEKIDNPILLVSKKGEETPVEINIAPIKSNTGETTGAVIVFRDFTEFRERQKQIEYLSFRDPLTGLYNRRYMEDAIKKMDIRKNLPLTLMVLDVNGLKLTNDAFGHVMGDKLLKTVADLLRQSCRADDVIARMGGDEFFILLPNTDEAKAERIKQRIKTAATKAKLDSIIVSLAIGYCVKKDMNESIEKIMINADNQMYREKLRFGRTMRNQTIETVLRNINYKYDNEQLHTERVSQYCEAIAIALNLSKKEIYDIRVAGSLHDIGKIMVPPDLLNKPGKLNDEEYEIIKRHPETGYQVLKSVDEYAALAEYLLYHHERWDGKGYPAGLKGTEIPLPSRIIAVADAYEAMTARRPYQKTRTTEEAKAELEKYAGTQFDPNIVKVFLELI